MFGGKDCGNLNEKSKSEFKINLIKENFFDFTLPQNQRKYQ